MRLRTFVSAIDALEWYCFAYAAIRSVLPPQVPSLYVLSAVYFIFSRPRSPDWWRGSLQLLEHAALCTLGASLPAFPTSKLLRLPSETSPHIVSTCSHERSCKQARAVAVPLSTRLCPSHERRLSPGVAKVNMDALAKLH